MSTLKVGLQGSEKNELPSASWYSASQRSNEALRKRRTVGLAIGFLGLMLGAQLVHKSVHFSCLHSSLGILPLDYNDRQAVCPQVGQLLPETNKELWEKLSDQISTDEFKATAIQWLSGAVQVPTESYDKMDPVGVDPRWEKFGPFHDYLAKAFPNVHANLNITKVNTWGLVYEWPGSDESLQPVLLAAHQDVVPVDPRTVDEWVHPPFSGYYDGDRIWGRGSSDDKSGLVGTLSAIETLVKSGFQPKRKIVLAFGFDEEVSGVYGAQELGKFLEAKYGVDSFAMVVDEGGGYSTQYGGVFAVPAVGEKGYLDTRVEVTSPGGHSSIPPSHTSIGILASLLVHFESNPIPAEVDRTTPIYNTLKCVAAYAPEMDRTLRRTILHSIKSDKSLKKLEKIIATDKSLKSFVGTTQAIDLIEGGVKTNALPELAWAVVNHRIATQSSVGAVKERDERLLASLADNFNLTYNAFGKSIRAGSSGSLTLTDAWGTALEPAPVSPTDSDAYKLLSGTIQSTYNTHRGLDADAEEVKVAPGIMTGNTDTRYYWKLTRNIFRYNHNNLFSGGNIPGGIHTVNESIPAENFLEMIRFFITLILNADENDI